MDTLHASSEFAGQFVLGRERPRRELANWRETRLGDGRCVWSHPALPIVSVETDSASVCLLGTAIATCKELSSNQQVAVHLASLGCGFTSLEQELSTLGGRWLVIVVAEGQSRVYHDACGLQSVFYTTASDAPLFVASNPSLLHHLGIVESVGGETSQFKQAGYWPPQQFPFAGVRQLLPNHCLKLCSGTSARYWPSGAPDAEIPGADSAPRIMELLGAYVDALVARGPVSIPLTAGHDSRLLLAASTKHWNEIEFFTLYRPDMKHHDLDVPRRIARRLGLNYRFYYEEQDEELNQLLLRNVGGMNFDASAQSMNAGWRRAAGRRVILSGTAGEVLRTFFAGTKRAAGAACRSTTASDLAIALRFPVDDPQTLCVLDEWIAEFPPAWSEYIFDIAYWELRIGIRFAVGFALRDAVRIAVPPMNSRQLLLLGLMAPEHERTAPYPLFRRLIKMGHSELLDWSFNRDWVDRLNKWGDRVRFPWRLKRWAIRRYIEMSARQRDAGAAVNNSVVDE